MENDPLIGRQLGAYRIQDKLGEGGMAQVYKAYDPRLQREVAIKVILSQIAEQGGFRKRFEQEIRLSAQLEHHNIVRVYDVGQSGDLTYLVMQYVAGGTLREQLRRVRALEPRKAAQYALQMARALHYAHTRGIIHRDVKPQNMLVSASDSNELLLSDFGIAKVFDTSLEETIAPPTSGVIVNSQGLTNVGQMVGTAEYMAPEQINLQPVDARTDVYALGIVLFQMLSGQTPFKSSSAQGLIYQQIFTIPPSVRELNPAVPETLARITAKALAKAPEARFQSAQEMAQALEAFLAPSSISSLHGTLSDYSTVFRPSDKLPAYPLTPPPPPPPASSYQGQQAISGGPSVSGPGIGRATGSSVVTPALPRRRSQFPLSYIMVGIIVVLVSVFSIWRPAIPGFPGGTVLPAGMATPFTETFHDNQRSWTIGNLSGLTANTPGNGNYILATDSATNTYFPNPGAIGTLPTNFTLTVQIVQNTGNLNVPYGLAFRLRQIGGNVYCYAFVINGQGDYQILKYNADVSLKPDHLWDGQQLPAIHSGLNQSNILQAIVQGNTFSFKVNGTPVPLSGGIQRMSDSSSPYTSGQLALLVSGPNSQFTVTQVQLAIP